MKELTKIYSAVESGFSEHQASVIHQFTDFSQICQQHCICNITFLNYKKSVQLILPSRVEIQAFVKCEH